MPLIQYENDILPTTNTDKPNFVSFLLNWYFLVQLPHLSPKILSSNTVLKGDAKLIAVPISVKIGYSEIREGTKQNWFFCKNFNRYFCLAHRSGPFQWRDTLTPFQLLAKHCIRTGQKMRLDKGTPEIIHIGEDSYPLEDSGIVNVLFF